MLTQERYQTILNILNERSAVTVAELSQLLDTSESTIRRDLTALDEMGKLKKVFGGATSLKQTAGVIEDNKTDYSHEFRVMDTKKFRHEYYERFDFESVILLIAKKKNISLFRYFPDVFIRKVYKYI